MDRKYVDYSYDEFGNKVSMTTYRDINAAGRRTAIAKSGTAFKFDDVVSYGYNQRSELTNAVAAVDTNCRYSYQYDHVGNRETSSERGTNTIYAATELNQYTAVDDFVQQFDDDGNQTLVKTATGIWQVTYNGENRPARWENGDSVITMSYDRMGRRVTKNDQRFDYNGYLQIASFHSTTTTSDYNYFVWDPTEPVATRPLAWQRSALGTQHSTLFYTHDGNKNVSEVTASNNDVSAHYEYAPFGALTVSRGESAAANPWRFSSEYSDDELGCVYYNYRHYEPITGRWMSRDPIGESGCVNTMCYIANSLENVREFLGLFQTINDVCVDAVSRAMGGDGYKDAKKYLDKKAKNKKGKDKVKCKVKVFCKCCNGMERYYEGGSYDDDTGYIVICENRLFYASDRDGFAKTVLKHEMMHAIQNCDGPVDDSCDSSICREIHAYYNSSALLEDREDSKRFIVEAGVLYSSKSFCPKCTEKDMREKIDAMYESCKSKWNTK